MKRTDQRLPRARKSQLVTREFGGELLVYDRNRDRAHCLNPTAALVWAHCDGRTTIAKMAQLLEVEMKVPGGSEVVWLALDQLKKSDLLDDSYVRPVQPMSRRGLVMRLGVAAAVTLPFIRSITAPTAAQAATCLPNGATCVVNADCCSLNCVDNGRGVFQCT
jgi:hypothetical protein